MVNKSGNEPRDQHGWRAGEEAADQHRRHADAYGILTGFGQRQAYRDKIAGGLGINGKQRGQGEMRWNVAKADLDANQHADHLGYHRAGAEKRR